MRKLSILVALVAGVVFGQTPTPVPYAVNGYGQIPTVFVNAVIAPTPTPIPTVLPTNLVALYELNEGSGTTAHDTSGNGNDLTLIGQAAFNQYGVHIPGTPFGNGMQTAVGHKFVTNTPWSFIFVYKTPNPSTLFYYEYISYEQVLSIWGDGKLNVTSSDGHVFSNSATYNNDLWTYIAIRKTIGGQVTFWRDGVQNGTQSQAGWTNDATRNSFGSDGSNVQTATVDIAYIVYYNSYMTDDWMETNRQAIKAQLAIRGISLP